MKVAEDERRPAPAAKAQPTVYAHQEQAYRELLATARVLFSGQWHDLPVQPRFNVLVTGPSGFGKTALVRMVARDLSVPICEVSTGSWVLLGASGRGAIPTWPSLFDFLRHHAIGVIFVDEIDKIAGAGEWSTYLRSELYTLLDRRVPVDLIRAANLSSDLPAASASQRADQRIAQLNLERGMLIIGAGAFQSYWEQLATRSIGFQAVGEKPDADMRPVLDSFRNLLARELTNRFRAQVVYLEPMRLAGYVRMLHETARRLPPEMLERFLETGYESAQAAVESRLGCRWTEELITQVLAELLPEPWSVENSVSSE